MRRAIRTILLLLATVLLLVRGAAAQTKAEEITATVDPASGMVRPFDTAIIQVQVYGSTTRPDGKPARVRLEPGGAAFRLLDENGGWLSKPFADQGDVKQKFLPRLRVLSQPISTGSLLDLANTPALRDSALYTAPDRPGTYRVEVSLEGKTAVATLRVDPAAPSTSPAERVSFAKESPPADPYRKLAEHYAPFIAQETWFDSKADIPTRFDFDGDWRGDNNWDDSPIGSSQAYVYYATMETGTHWFLIYNFFHPRNYAERCILGSCHENDNEGIILTIRKDGSVFGRLQVMETLAHNRVYSYRADSRVADGLHHIAGEIEFADSSHPIIYIEPAGHGVFGSQDTHSIYSVRNDAFAGSSGMTFTYQGEAQRPKHANDRRVSYDLLPIYEQWWQRAIDGTGRRDSTFDDFNVYKPKGDRLGTSSPEIPFSFLGRNKAPNRAKPFWGWIDLSSMSALATGQWGLDPAYSVSQTVHFPADEALSLDYVFNPYLLTGGNPR